MNDSLCVGIFRNSKGLPDTAFLEEVKNVHNNRCFTIENCCMKNYHDPERHGTNVCLKPVLRADLLESAYMSAFNALLAVKIVQASNITAIFFSVCITLLHIINLTKYNQDHNKKQRLRAVQCTLTNITACCSAAGVTVYLICVFETTYEETGNNMKVIIISRLQCAFWRA